MVMVVNKKFLFNNDYFEGFKSHDETDYESRILKNFSYMKREPAENDIMHKQPIAYSIIVNPSLKKVFACKRASKDSKYGEKRLQGKWSWGVGGHIEKVDTVNGNPIHESMLRELGEEVYMDGTVTPKMLGYINNDSDDVGKFHFGVLYILETDSKIVKPKSPEIDNGKLRTIQELEEMCLNPDYTVEEWSKISLEPLKKYLQTFQ